jgi:hypothetical protein
MSNKRKISNIDFTIKKRIKYSCDECSYDCSYNCKYFKHPNLINPKTKNLQIHLEIKYYECKYENCSSKYLFQLNLNEHINKIHDSVRVILNNQVLQIKNNSFDTPVLNNSTQKIKNSLIPENIEKSIILNNSALQINEKFDVSKHIHKINSKGYRCDYCNYECNYKYMIDRHIFEIHLEKVKNFKCNYCDYECLLMGNLKRHVSTIHLKIKNHKCIFCDYKFSFRYELNNHINSRHSALLEEHINNKHSTLLKVN